MSVSLFVFVLGIYVSVVVLYFLSTYTFSFLRHYFVELLGLNPIIFMTKFVVSPFSFYVVCCCCWISIPSFSVLVIQISTLQIEMKKEIIYEEEEEEEKILLRLISMTPAVHFNLVVCTWIIPSFYVSILSFFCLSGEQLYLLEWKVMLLLFWNHIQVKGSERTRTRTRSWFLVRSNVCADFSILISYERDGPEATSLFPSSSSSWYPWCVVWFCLPCILRPCCPADGFASLSHFVIEKCPSV